MNPSAIVEAWRAAFGEVSPGDVRWERPLGLRVHHLPGSKQFPESVGEYAEALRRHNVVATRVLGDGADCLLFVGLWPSSDLAVEANRFPDRLDLSFVSLVGLPSSRDYEAEVSFSAASIVWRAGAFDDVIRDVVDERLPVIVFANLDRATSYVPYPGGADLICASAAERAELSTALGAWLPAES